MQWLSVHMIIHVLEMFYLPPLLIIGAPWVPLLFALPVGPRRRLLRAYYQSRSRRWLRGRVRSVLTNPIVAMVLFNAVMVLWHIPVIFDWASWHGWVMNWLMAPSFVLVGLLFWRVILPSHPWPARGSTRMQIAAIVVTAFEMLVLAMAMSIFTKGPWYSMNVLMDGAAAALRDQRWAAGILWVCGDFWAVPALVLIAMRISGIGGRRVGFVRAGARSGLRPSRHSRSGRVVSLGRFHHLQVEVPGVEVLVGHLRTIGAWRSRATRARGTRSWPCRRFHHM